MSMSLYTKSLLQSSELELKKDYIEKDSNFKPIKVDNSIAVN